MRRQDRQKEGQGRPIRRLSPSFSPLGLSSASHPLRNARRENSIFAVVVGLVTIWTGYIRSAGLDPHSLWYDDLWVAAVVKLDSLFEAISLQVPAPPAFIGALWLSRRLVPDPELSLQLVPFCASLAVIPVLAVVVATISRSRAFGVVAGSLMALSPNVAYYSVFVKQYTVDVLAIAGLLLIAVRFFRSRDVRYLHLGAGLSIVSVLFSFPSVFAGAVFVNLAAVMHVWPNDPAHNKADPVIRTALAYNLVLGVVFLLVVSGRSNANVTGYWAAGFLPIDSADAAWRFLSTRGFGAIRNALPAALASGVPLVGVGLVWLIAKPAWRWLGFFVLLVYLAAVVASGLQLYPISGGGPDRPALARTDLFSYPLTVMPFTVGIGALTSWLPRRAFANIPLCVLALALVAVRPAPASYFPLDHSRFVRLMDGFQEDTDGVVLWSAARFLGGYYSSWPIRAVTTPDLNNNLEIHLERPNSLTLPAERVAMRSALETFLSEGQFRRIIYLTTRARAGQQDPVFAIIARHGYREAQKWSSTVRTHLIVYQRTTMPEDGS